MLFVDGSIIENTDVIFHITQSFALNIDTIPDEAFVNDAILQIIDSNGNRSEPAVSLGRGKYQIRIGELNTNMQYGIRIEHDGDVFESTLSRPLVTPEVNIRWQQYEPLEAVYFYLSTHDETGENNFFLWHYDEVWETMGFGTNIRFDPITNTFHPTSISRQCWKRNAAYEFGTTEALTESRIIDRLLFQVEPGCDRFFYLYSLTVTQKSVSQGAFEFHQNMKIQNEEMGGIFTPQPAEVLGNIRCITNPQRRIMGYINTLKNVSQERIFIRRWHLRWPSLDWCGEHIMYCNIREHTRLMEQDFSPRFLYSQGYRPYAGNYYDGHNFAPYSWMRASCIDCRERDNTIERPYFFPHTGLELHICE